MRKGAASLLACVGTLLLAACAAAPPGGFKPEAVDLRPIWEARLRGQEERALEAADRLGWAVTHSVAGERERQELRLRRGERGRLRKEIADWRAAEPDNPDLAYLDARLLQDPERLERRLERSARRWPSNTWIQLGLAARSLVRAAAPLEIRAHLRSAAPRAEAAPFRRRLEARLLARTGALPAALERLEGDAFRRSDPESLLLYGELARRGGMDIPAARTQAELRLLRIGPESPLPERVDAAAERALAELRAGQLADLEAFLGYLDRCCASARLQAGWSALPRYRIGVFGSLVRPEREVGGPVAEWASAGRALLVGEALFHGLEALYLKGVQRVAVPWPGIAEPIEILIADGATASRPNDATGGTIFRGFYIRRDLVRATARYLETATAEVPAKVELPELPPDAATTHGIPEDLDLPLRLRAQLLRAGENAEDLETEQLLLHEAGHLPDLLPWLPEGPSLWNGLPPLFGSLLRHGDGMAWLEERAETRALAISPHPRWALAEIVAIARGRRNRYGQAYRRLLRGLLAEARRRELPPLPRWDQLEDAQVRRLASAYLQRRSWTPLDLAAVTRLLTLTRAPGEDG